MAKNIKEIKALTRGVGFGNNGKNATIELSPADVAAIEKAEANNPVAEINEPESKEGREGPADAVDPEVVTPLPINMDAVQKMIVEAIATSNDAHQKELDAAQEAHQAELNEVRVQAEADVNAAKAQTEELQNIITTLGLDKFKGEAQPVTNDSPNLSGQMTVHGAGSPESRKFEAILNQRPSVMVEAVRGGMVRQTDSRASDEYFLNNQDRIRDGIEAQMKESGFLQGSRVVNAPTGIADLPSISFEYLSANMRNTHFPNLIHWQFATYKLELGQGPGLVIAVPRHEDIPRPATFSDRVLVTGQRLNTDTQATQEKNVLVQLLELGLGKDTANTVVGFSTFVSSYSLYNLEQIITEKLGRDHALTKDMGLYEQWFAADLVYYNNEGTPTTTPGDVNVSADNVSGVLTQKFLINLRARMGAAEIPTYDDGCYGLALNPFALAQYMADKSSKERDDAMSGMDLVGKMLANSTGNMYGGEVSGYRGKYDGFHIFEQNRYGVGSLVTDPGINNVTLGSGATLMDSSFAFGPRTLAWAEGLPAEIRVSSDDDFQRQRLITWYSHGAPKGLNVIDDATTGEQRRVVEFRTVRSV